MKIIRNFFGAFGDAAILFPMIALLNIKSGIPVSNMLASTALVYLFSSLFYRIPMPVQPLKSIAMAAVSVGATMSEIKLATICVGVFCVSLLLVGPRLEALLAKIPNLLIHQLQVGLGVLLIMQGLKSYGLNSFFTLNGILIIILVLFLILKSEIRGLPVLGAIATIAFFLGLYQVNNSDLPAIQMISSELNSLPRWSLILSLVIPQIALTMGNSVLSTKNICDRIYPQTISESSSARITYRRLLGVIGFGNILFGLIGGMPFCHGSGGVTAHSRAGATHWLSTFFLGIVLLMMTFLIPENKIVVIPAFLLSVLLITVGVFHLKLSNLSWSLGGWSRFNLISSALVVLFTQNLLWIFPVFLIVKTMSNLKNFHIFAKLGATK